MKKKLALILTTAAALALASVPALAESEEAPAATEAGASAAEAADMLSNTYFMYAFDVEGLGAMTYYFHFYDEVPGAGHIFYAGMAMNQVNFCGTYEVLHEGHDYEVYMDRDAESATQGTSEYTVVFYDFSGNEMDRLGLDEGVLYNDSGLITTTGGTPCAYYQDEDPENGKYAETYEAEVPQKILDFVADDDATCTLTIYHNGTYLDLMELYVEGTWALEKAEDGSKNYILTPDNEGDTAAVLNVAADEQTAQYTADGGEAVAMTNTAEPEDTVEVTSVMTGEQTLGEGDSAMDVTYTLNIYSDGTVALLINLYGTDYDLDAGTMELADDGFTMNFHFDGAGDLSSVLDEETYAITLDYALAGTDLGDVETVLTLQN